MEKLSSAFESGLMFNKVINAIVLMVLGAFFAAFIVRKHILLYIQLRKAPASCGIDFAFSFRTERGSMFNQMKIGQTGIVKLNPVDAVGTPLPPDTPIGFESSPLWSLTPVEAGKLSVSPERMQAVITPSAVGDIQVAVTYKLQNKEMATKSMMITVGAGDVADLDMSFQAN